MMTSLGPILLSDQGQHKEGGPVATLILINAERKPQRLENWMFGPGTT